MALFDDIKDTISSVSKEGINRAREWKDQAKVAVEIKNLQGLIEKKYAEIGRAYYKDHKGDEKPAYTQMRDITEAFAAIQKLKKQQDDYRGIKRCPNCGGTIDSFANFCPCCGAKCEIEIPKEEPVVEEAPEEDVFADAKEVTEEPVEEALAPEAETAEPEVADEAEVEIATGAETADAQKVEAE